MSTRAIVKSVLSGDTVIVRPKEAPAKGQPAKERVLHLAGITAPRVGSSVRDDEPWAFPAREYLRAHLVGKEVAFTIAHTIPSGGEFANVFSSPPGPGQPPQDVAMLVVSAGWAKARDNASEALKDAEAKAQAEGKGLWATEAETQRTVSFQMPADPHAFIAEHKGKDLDAIVEQVRDGTQLRVRLILDDSTHQFINLVVAGAKSPRASIMRDGGATGAEPWGEEAKYFTEIRLLQRPIKVRLLSAPVSLGANPLAGPTPDGSLPAPSTGASFIIGQAIHPNGNIAEFLTGAGLAKVIDWHAGILAPYGGLDRLRAAERAAKEKRACLWEGYGAAKSSAGPGAAPAAAPGAPSTKGQAFDATVVRVWGPDQLSIVAKGDGSGKERRVQLASVRGPRGSDPKNTFYAGEAKEFLRKRLVGKVVHVVIDYVKPRDGEYEERECVTITYGGQNNNVSEQLIEKGLATVLRHRRDDEERSAEFDKLIIAEQTAAAEARGLHSPKDVPVQQRIVDASENANRAAQYLPSWKRAGRHPAVVDFVSGGHRFKLLLPKEHAKITFVLAGIKAPRTARTANEKSEPYGPEAHQFASRFMQRDVEVAFDSNDKQGGFIGAMYAGGQNVAVELVRAGLASVHEYSAQALPFGAELLAAEEEAKKERKNIWSNFTGEETAVVEDNTGALPSQYLDIYVSAVKESEPFGFNIQVLEDKSVAALEKLMGDLSLHNRNAANAAPAGFSPRTGDIVAAKWSEDNQWYRAKVKKASGIKKEATVYLMDYGNEETMPFSRIRPLDAKFKSLPGQAREARLSFVKLPPKDSEYGPDARRRFAQFTEGRKLVANVDQREGNLLHLRLIDPSDPNAADDPLACINADLVRDGLATLDKSCRYISAYPQVVKKINQACEGAKADRLGIFEFGDVSED